MKESQSRKYRLAADKLQDKQIPTGGVPGRRIIHVTDEDFESSVLFIRHMQLGHGKEYTDLFCPLSAIPLESL